MDQKRLHILIGFSLFALTAVALNGTFGPKASIACGLTLWMGYWWITRPVDIAVTSLLPIAVNAAFDLVPSGQVINQYFSEIVVLLIGSDMISLTWSNTGLDKRLAMRALQSIGTSMHGQIAVWLFASTALSIFLPNVVVAMIMLPIAVSMLRFMGEEDVGNSAAATAVFLAIAWGSGIGGFGSPLGGSANLTAISYLERIIGHEFMYVDWIVRFVPFLIIVALLNLVFLLMIPLPRLTTSGTREYFRDMYRKLGRPSLGEKISFILFALATILAFARPVFSDLLPAMRPAYIFFILGLATFLLRDERGQALLTWRQAQKELMWGMFFLFAGGLALGRLVTETGAAAALAEQITKLPLTGGMETVGVFVAFSTLLTEISSNTAAASIAIPVVEGICQQLSISPVAYILVTIVAVNCAYILPVSTRAIPVSYGLRPDVLFRRGIALTLVNAVLTTVLGYAVVTLFPGFGAI